VKRKRERAAAEEKMGSQRRECLSFSSRPVLFLVPYLFSPSLFLFFPSAGPGVLGFGCVSLEHSRLSVSQCLCEGISVCVREREREMFVYRPVNMPKENISTGPVDQIHMSGTRLLSDEQLSPNHHADTKNIC